MTRAQGRYFDVLFVMACLVALVSWLAMSAGQTFMIDEWEFVMNAHDWSFDRLNEPLNGHWSLGLALM